MYIIILNQYFFSKKGSVLYKWPFYFSKEKIFGKEILIEMDIQSTVLSIGQFLIEEIVTFIYHSQA